MNKEASNMSRKKTAVTLLVKAAMKAEKAAWAAWSSEETAEAVAAAVWAAEEAWVAVWAKEAVEAAKAEEKAAKDKKCGGSGKTEPTAREVFDKLCQNCYHKTEPDWCEDTYETCPLLAHKRRC